MLFFLNILTIHQDALSLCTLACMRGGSSEPALVPLGFLPWLTPPAGKQSRDAGSGSRYPLQRLLPSQGHQSHWPHVLSAGDPVAFFFLLGPCFTSPQAFYSFIPALCNYHVEILKCIQEGTMKAMAPGTPIHRPSYVHIKSSVFIC